MLRIVTERGPQPIETRALGIVFQQDRAQPVACFDVVGMLIDAIVQLARFVERLSGRAHKLELFFCLVTLAKSAKRNGPCVASDRIARIGLDRLPQPLLPLLVIAEFRLELSEFDGSHESLG